jgi:uncharacterized protein
MQIAFAISGFAVGFIVGLTGVGGGSLMTPLLMLFFGVRPLTAVGTDLIYAAVTKSGGVWVHGRRGTVEWRIVGLLAGGSLPASAITMWVMSRIGLQRAALESITSTTLGIALILTAVSLVFRNRLLAWVDAQKRVPGDDLSRRRTATVAVGALLGIIVSISSIGAGALGTMALFFLYPRLPAVRIVGTDIAHAVPLTLVAGLFHYRYFQSIDSTLLVNLLVGSLPGIWLGSHLSARISDRTLRPLLAGMLVLIGGKLVF